MVKKEKPKINGNRTCNLVIDVALGGLKRSSRAIVSEGNLDVTFDLGFQSSGFDIPESVSNPEVEPHIDVVNAITFVLVQLRHLFIV